MEPAGYYPCVPELVLPEFLPRTLLWLFDHPLGVIEEADDRDNSLFHVDDAYADSSSGNFWANSKFLLSFNFAPRNLPEE